MTGFDKRSYGDTCPIAAQASQGALALIRTSGKGVLELLSKVFSRPQALLDAPGNIIVYGWITEHRNNTECASNECNTSGSCNSKGANYVDQALISVFRAPHSYTGEDAADISCHGGSAAAKAVLDVLRKAGFHDALPGEFTFRAFMNGKIDLTRSESVMEIVSAKTKQGLEHAVKRLSGALEKEIKAIRDTLLDAVCSAELYLDYPEDEIDSGEENSALSACFITAKEALQSLNALSASYRRERLYQEGALAVIAGSPNAGKSSLFNALLKEDRAIVTAKPGTTRDWLEAFLDIQGIPVRLVDTAGLRGIEDAEEAEIHGINRSKNLIEEADLILYTIDGSKGITKDDEIFIANKEYSERLLLIWNKADIEQPQNKEYHSPWQIQNENLHLTVLSAKTGRGIEDLCAAIAQLLFQNNPFIQEKGGFNAGLGAQRQKDLCDKAASCLKEALDLAAKDEPLDIIAPFLREALNFLGEIVGEVSSADILETMFNRFCLGK